MLKGVQNTWLNNDLPSDDEEDDDFDPTKEVDQGDEAKKKKANKRKRVTARGAAGLDSLAGGEDEDSEEEEEDKEEDLARPKTHKERERMEKVSDVWDKIKAAERGAGASEAGGEDAGPSSAAADAPAAKKPKLASLADINQLCRPVKKEKTGLDKTSWMRHMGLFAPANQAPGSGPAAAAAKPKPAAPSAAVGGGPSAAGVAAGKLAPEAVNEERKAAAAAAMSAAKAAMSLSGVRAAGKVQITETRRFAGKDLQVTRMVDEESKDAKKAQQAQALKSSGLDSLLSEYDTKKKVSVIDKSRMDWDSFKKTNTAVDEELEGYKKSDQRYLERIDFLKRAELREYEKERDARLAADVRTRGRL